jgi:hypothetical protein
MNECQNVTAAWGTVCKSCGATLPNPGPIRSWQAVRHEGSDDHRRIAVEGHFYRKHRETGLFAKPRRAA